MQYFISFFIVSGICQAHALPVQEGSGFTRQCPITVLEQSAGSITLQISTGSLRRNTVTREGTDFQVFGAQGFGFLQKTGLPLLPSMSKYLVTGPGSSVGITILRSDVRELEGIRVFPAQDHRIEVPGETRDYPFQMNRQFYRTDRYYPASPVQATQSVDYRGIPMTRIQISPLLYHASTGKVKWYKSLVVKLEYQPLRSAGPVGKRALEMVKSRVLNGGSPTLRRPLLKTARQTADDETDVVIVTTNEFSQAADTMAAWQRMKGFDVHIEARDSWTSDEVKEFVHGHYASCDPAPGYLLIIGDHEHVPAQHIPWPTGPIPYASDLYYTCMGGAGDYLPEMARGRISPSNAGQAMLIVKKNINYEKNPPEEAAFYTNALAGAYFQDGRNWKHDFADRRFAQTVEEVKTYLDDFDIESERVFFTEDSINPTNWEIWRFSWGEPIPEELLKPGFAWDGDKDDIIRIINDGVFLVYHADHGLPWGWEHPKFFVADFGPLNNGDLLPIILSIDCLTGSFHMGNDTAIFAEELQRMENGGAVGIVAATSFSYSGANDGFLLGMIDAIWPDPGIVLNTRKYPDPEVTPTVPSFVMGDVMDQGLFRMSETYPDDPDAREGWTQHQFEMYHYFGDPTVKIWTSRPREITVTHEEAIDPDAGTFTLSGFNMQEGMAVLCDAESGVIIGRTEISGGDVSIPLPDSLEEGDELALSITGHNYLPHIRTLPVGDVVGTKGLRKNAVSVEMRGSRLLLRVPGQGGFRVLVYRPDGEIRHRLTRANFTSGLIELDMGSDGPGVYFVEVETGEEKLCRKISVLR